MRINFYFKDEYEDNETHTCHPITIPINKKSYIFFK